MARISMVFAFLTAILAFAGPAAADPFLEHSVTRWGGDYRSLSMPAGAQGCAAACAVDESCKAWTYERPREDRPDGLCRLKDTVPARVASPCCVSGVSVGTSALNTSGPVTALQKAPRFQRPRQKPAGLSSPPAPEGAPVKKPETSPVS